MSSRYYGDDDRFRDRGYRRQFDRGDYRGGREWSERSRRNYGDNEEPFSRLRDRERGYDDRYGAGYEPRYGTSYRARYSNRYEARPDYGHRYDPEEMRRNEWRFREYARDYDRGYGREYGERGRQDRGWWERMSDEVASWFGDEEAERRRRMDEMTGSHKGKGPRGYKRSDERIREDISDRLTDYSHLDASNIEVTVSEGAVILEGWVDSRWAKRSAEDIVETVSGVQDVRNNLRVHRQASETAASQTVDAGNELLGTAGSRARAKGA